MVREQGRQGAYAEDRSIRVLGVEIPSIYLLPRRDEYTRVYTTVYPRVHNCIHACTLPRSKYLLCRARLYVCFFEIMPRISSDGLRLPGIRNDTLQVVSSRSFTQGGLRLPGIRNDTPEDPKSGVCERDHALSLVLGLLVSVGVDLAGSSISRHDHSYLPSLYIWS